MFRPGLMHPRAALAGVTVCQIGSPLDFLAQSEEPRPFRVGGSGWSPPARR
jgi:hypothetical protein